MDTPSPKTDAAHVRERIIAPDEELSAAGKAALERRSVEEHERAIELARRHR